MDSILILLFLPQIIVCFNFFFVYIYIITVHAYGHIHNNVPSC